MKSRLTKLFIGAFLIMAANSCQQSNYPGHPRILLFEGEEKAILEQVEKGGTWGKIHAVIIDECENILRQEPLERIQIGRRLLSTSREYLRRVLYLSYAYRMTGDERFSAHAERHLLKAAGFSDWNPTHFLDVAEMTMALAIGYDWLFDELTETSKQTIREAIVKKGLEPSYNEDYNWFLQAEHNWNQVCNAGMTFGALAIREDHTGLADSVINRAFETIPLAMHDYRPDGAYPEGYGYWGYGTSFNVVFLSAVEKALGTDRELSASPGFLKTAGFLQHMLAPSNACYNWGDCGARGNLNPAMFWFAAKNNDPSLLWSERKFLETDDDDRFARNQFLPVLMIWGKDIPLDQIQAPASKVWMGQGKNPVCLMRTSWTDPDAIYLGFKAGSPSVNHAHMDVGSFILEADGIRWVSDLGSQNYESLESKGMSIFGRTQDAQRWTIFRLNNYAHSTLTINNELQKVDGYARIDKYAEQDEFMFAVSDFSSLYNGLLKKAVRGAGIKDGKYIVVRDEVETDDKPARVRWNLVTPANVELGTKGAILSSDGEILYLKVQGPENIKMKTWSTAPTNDYDAENPGTIMVGFEYTVPANTSESFEVLLVPSKSKEDAGFSDASLDEW
jgi:hypothetical protein